MDYKLTNITGGHHLASPDFFHVQLDYNTQQLEISVSWKTWKWVFEPRTVAMFDGDYDYDSLPVIFIWRYKVLWDRKKSETTGTFPWLMAMFAMGKTMMKLIFGAYSSWDKTTYVFSPKKHIASYSIEWWPCGSGMLKVENSPLSCLFTRG